MFALLIVSNVNPLFSTELTSISAAHAEDTSADAKIDINTATKAQFKTLKGIGKKLAKRIVKDRKENGPFTSVDDLRRVRGIGKKKLENNRHRLKATQPQGSK
jgi:competence protein ComEA